jgi:hypothetical protein
MIPYLWYLFWIVFYYMYVLGLKGHDDNGEVNEDKDALRNFTWLMIFPAMIWLLLLEIV